MTSFAINCGLRRDECSSLQVKEIMMDQDSNNENILFVTVWSKRPDMFKAVMSCLDHLVGSPEVWNMNS